MNYIEMKARAKINLSLDVLNRRYDGYHDVRMIMQTVELHDKVRLEVIERGIELSCRYPWVPEDGRNIAYKAADLFMKRFDIKNGVRIKISKKIPVAAGLAGGSADAAAVLRGMNRLFGVGLETKELMALGKELGADVPYCIKGGTMLAEGIGDILTPLSSVPPTNIVLIKPRIGVSTAWVYGNLNLDNLSDRPDTQMLIDSITQGDMTAVAKNMKNVLETVTIDKYKIISQIKRKLNNLGALGSMMSGSGPTVFALFENESSARNAYAAMKSSRWDRYLTMTATSPEDQPG